MVKRTSSLKENKKGKESELDGSLVGPVVLAALVLAAPVASARHRHHRGTGRGGVSAVPDASCKGTLDSSFVANGDGRLTQTLTAEPSGMLSSAQTQGVYE